MKRFSDLLDIDLQVPVVVHLDPVCDNGAPHCEVRVNGEPLLCAVLDRATIIHRSVSMLAPIMIEVEMQGKQYDQHRETAVVISTVQIDGVDIVPRFVHLTSYDNERDQHRQTNYLGFNGTWRLHIDAAFYTWLHRAGDQGWLFEPHETKHRQKNKPG